MDNDTRHAPKVFVTLAAGFEIFYSAETGEIQSRLVVQSGSEEGPSAAPGESEKAEGKQRKKG